MQGCSPPSSCSLSPQGVLEAYYLVCNLIFVVFSRVSAYFWLQVVGLFSSPLKFSESEELQLICLPLLGMRWHWQWLPRQVEGAEELLFS